MSQQEHDNDQVKATHSAENASTEAEETAENTAETGGAAQHNNGRAAEVEYEAANEDVEVVEGEETEDPAQIVQRLEAELAEVRARADQYLDQMQRSAAEFQNARKRHERQTQESIDRAAEGLIRRLLPVLDDFDLAFNNIPSSLEADEAAWVDGFRRIHQKLTTLLIEEGTSPMPKEGPFDPNRHEAVTNEPNDEVESGHIIETLRTGYEYRDRVLRPALVRVAQ